MLFAAGSSGIVKVFVFFFLFIFVGLNMVVPGGCGSVSEAIFCFLHRRVRRFVELPGGFLAFLFILFVPFFVFVENQAAGLRFGFDAGLGFFVFGFDETGGERAEFFVAQSGGAGHGFNGFLGVFVCGGQCFFDVFRRSAFVRYFMFCFGVGQNPVRQAASETARAAGLRRLAETGARRRFFEIGLALLGFFNGSYGLYGTRAMLGETLAGQNDIVFARFGV